MGMTVILFNDEEPFEQSVNIPWTEGPMWNLVKIGQVVLGWRRLKISRYIPVYSTGARADNSWGANFLS